MPKTKTMQQIERERGKPITEVLRELYTLYGSQTAVAHALGVNQGTLSVWLVKLGLEQRTTLVEKTEKAS